MARVLLVDDDVLVRNVVRLFLERAGHAVAEAADGVEALEAFDTERPDVVVTDLRMPRMNGLEMMMEMRRRWPAAPVVAMSGGGSGDAECWLLLAQDLGAAGTFEKPLDMPALMSTVQRLAAAIHA